MLRIALVLVFAAAGSTSPAEAIAQTAQIQGQRAAVDDVLIEAGRLHAGRRFRIVPMQDGVPAPALAGEYDRLDGVLNGNGRALVQFDRSLVGRTQVEHSVRIAGLPAGQGRVTVSSSSSAVLGTTIAPAGTVGGPIQASPLVRVTLPQDGAVVGSPSVDVRGRLAGPLNAANAEVRVNGQLAEVFPSTSGQGRFLLANFEITNGSNAIVVEASIPGGPQSRQDIAVSLDRLTSNNVAVRGDLAYAARGTQGFAVMDLRTREYETFSGPAGAARVDDLAIDGDLLFLLDGASGGNLSVWSLADPEQPALVSGPVSVPVSPFAGVSARSGRVVVSGGTSLLTVRSYTPQGQLGTPVASIDLGIGQPDVLVSDDGQRAFVSTDFAGTFGGAGFGISTIQLNAPPTAPNLLSRTGLVGSGFTGGSQGPANFPIESAEFDGTLVTAHGGGLTRITAGGQVAASLNLGFPAVNVDDGPDSVFVVGTGRRLAEVALPSVGGANLLSTQNFPGPGAFTSVAAHPIFLAIASNNGGLRVIRR